MDVRPGALVDDRYRVRARVGEGGMGTVWSAFAERDGRDVALKVLKATGDDQLRRLLREARIAQRLEHPNVVAVEEILAASSNAPVLVMELLQGESLRERLSRIGALAPEDAARVVADAAAAVGAAHALGIVHRDLKPENIFIHLDRDRTVVKVLDFGIAKLATSGELATGNMTRTGAMLGTPHYMAPEQVFGEGDIDGRADVWALGVVLFECLTSARPFDGDNAGQVFKAIAMGDAPSLEGAPHVPGDLAALTLRMLSRERDERPAIDEVEASLRRFASAELASAPRSSLRIPTDRPSVDPLAATLALDATKTPSPVEMAAATPSRLRATRMRGLAAAGVLVLGALVAFGFVPRARSESELLVVGPTSSVASPPPPAASASVALAMLASADPPGMPAATIEKPAAKVDVTPRPASRPTATVVPIAATTTPIEASRERAEPKTKDEQTSVPARLPGGVHGVSPY